jgi:hypothetical protein
VVYLNVFLCIFQCRQNMKLHKLIPLSLLYSRRFVSSLVLF